jgi:hypothetical protein
MPSEDSLVAAALQAMQAPAEEFHSSLARAVEDLGAFIARHRKPAGDPEDLVTAELGAFGAGHLDVRRFSALLARPVALEPDDLHHVERALEILSAAEARGTDLLCATVPAGGDLRDTVTRTLAEAGRVFGVIRQVAPLLDGHGAPLAAGSLPHGYPFSMWSRGERAVGPPLFIQVNGSDLNAAGLAEFLDGSQKIILVVHGTAPPAPLARLVSPHVLVLQTDDTADLGQVACFAGPAIAAVCTDGLISFVHVPGSGSGYASRLSVGDLPDSGPSHAVGAQSIFRQTEDLEHLRELSVAGSSAPSAAAAVGADSVGQEDADPVDRLAGWLLQQADLTTGD